MALIVGALPHSDWQLLTPLLEAMGWEPEQSPAPEGWYSSAGEGASLAGGDLYLLLHSRPERCIANALDQGTELRAAMALWQASAEQLLAAYRQQRSQAVLVDVKSACEAPQVLLDWLTANQPAFKTRATVAGQQSLHLGYIEDGDSVEHNVNLLVASQAVWQSSSIQRLLADLEASSVPLTHTASASGPRLNTPGIDVISTQLQLQHSQRKRFEARLEGKLEGLTEAHKAELRAWETRLKGLERDHEKAIEALQARSDEASQALAEARNEASRLAVRVKEQDLGLSEARAELARAERALNEHQTKVTYLSSELERFARDKHEEVVALRQKWTETEWQASQRIVDLEAALEEKDERLSEYAQTVARHERRLAYQTSEMEKFALDKHKDVVVFREKLTSMESEAQRQSALVDALMREREQLHAKVASLRTSWLSWITFPARWVYHSVRRIGKLFRGRGLRRAVRVIEQSELFDASWYALHYPDVIESGANPAEHYARFGAFEGRDPGPKFSSARYLKRNRDIAEQGINPLVHYELHGKHEGRSPR